MPDDARHGRKRSTWYPWALLLAAPVGLAAIPLVHGLRLPNILVLPVALMSVLAWSFVTDGALVRAARSPGPGVFRYWVGLGAALVAGLAVAVTAVAASWDHDVEAHRADSTQRDRWTAQYEGLIVERAMQQQELDRNAPDAEKDETVLQLEQRFRQVTTDLPDAEHAVVCERDGTCGTGRRGAGPNYREKVRARDDLRREFDTLPGTLDEARAAVAEQAAEIDRKKPAAEAALARIKLDLEDLGPRRPEPPGRVEAMFAVAGNHMSGMVLRFVAVTVLLLLDLLAAVGLVWLLRRASRLSTRDLVSRQGDWDLLGDGPGRAT